MKTCFGIWIKRIHIINKSIIAAIKCIITTIRMSVDISKVSCQYATIATGIGHHTSVDCVQGTVQHNMFNVLGIFSTVTHISVHKVEFV